jgi:predicted transcriptional regulator YdeE
MEGCPAEVGLGVGLEVGLEVGTPEPQVVQVAEILVMGMEVRTTQQQELNPQTAKIPQLWNRFLTEQIWQDIPEAIEPVVFYGVYTDCALQPLGTYSLIVARAVSSIDNPPENMVGVVIPAGQYLRFSVLGRSPQALQQTWRQIWQYFSAQTRYHRAFTTDFERYDDQQVSLYVGLKSVNSGG